LPGTAPPHGAGGGTSAAVLPPGSIRMGDVIFVLVTVAFFVVCGALVRGVERL